MRRGSLDVKPVDDTRSLIDQFVMRDQNDPSHGVPTVLAVAQVEAMHEAMRTLRGQLIDTDDALAELRAQFGDVSALDRARRKIFDERHNELERSKRRIQAELSSTRYKCVRRAHATCMHPVLDVISACNVRRFVGRREDLMERLRRASTLERRVT